jgi:hypothetical protein
MQKKLTLKNLFLADGIGGLVSTLVAIGFKPYFVSLFNVPETIAIVLAIIGLSYAAYSFTVSRLVQPKVNGRKFLTILVVANALYSAFCLVLLIVFYQSTSLWGVAYFLLDTCIVGLIAAFEWTQLRAGLE